MRWRSAQLYFTWMFPTMMLLLRSPCMAWLPDHHFKNEMLYTGHERAKRRFSRGVTSLPSA